MKYLKTITLLSIIFFNTGMSIKKNKNEILAQNNSHFEGIKRKNRILFICTSNFQPSITDSIYNCITTGFLSKRYQVVNEQQYTDFYKQEYRYLQDKILNNVLKTKKSDQFQIESQVRNHNYRLQKVFIYATMAIENNLPVINEFKWKTQTIPQQPYDTLKTFSLLNLSNRSILFVCNAFIDSVNRYNK